MRRIRARYGREMCRGFTLVELLVVVAVIAILLAMMLPNIVGVIERARIVTCRNNIKNLAVPFFIDAVDAGGRAQIDQWIGGRWMWDIDFDTRARVMGHGVSRNTFYCPSNRYQNDDVLWNFGNYCVTGYWFLIERPNIPDHPSFRTGYTDDIPGLVGRLSGSGSRKVMIADATIARNGNFTQVNGGWRMPHRTAHLDHDGRPTGGNVLFADGHAVWRNFSDMRNRLNMNPEHWW